MRALTFLVFLLLLACGTSARAEEIILVSGERLTGRIEDRTTETLVLEHAILGRLQIPITAVRSIDGRAISPTEPRPQQPGDFRPAAESQESSRAADATASPAPETKPEWDSQIELGATATEGSTQDANVRLAMKTSRKTPEHLFRCDVGYRLATSRGDRTENYFTTGFLSQWEKPTSRWSEFIQGRLDSDEFESWDHRLTFAGGVGYRLFDVKGATEGGAAYDIFMLTLRLGGGVRKEFGSENDDIAPEGLLGAEFAYRLNTHQKIVGAMTLYPDLAEEGEFRLVSNVDWTIDIDRLDNISLRLGIAHEYESRTDPTIPHNDLAAYAALVIDF